MSNEGGYRMITNPGDLPGAGSVLYIQGEGLHKCLMFLKSEMKVIVWIPFQELLQYYERKCAMIKVHNHWAINAAHIRHVQLNVPFQIGLVHLTSNTSVPINSRGCAQILNFLNLNRV